MGGLTSVKPCNVWSRLCYTIMSWMDSLGSKVVSYELCMQQVIKGHLLGYRSTMLCMGTAPSKFDEISAKISDWVTDPPRWFCDIL